MRAQYVAPAKRGGVAGESGEEARYANQIRQYVSKALKSQAVQASGQLWSDLQAVLEGQAIYVPNFVCEKNDTRLLQALTLELQQQAAEEAKQQSEGGGGGGQLVNWSKHLKHEDPTFSPTFRAVVERMAAHFDVEVFATRLNFYRDGSDWKPFHHDSHAYGGHDVREDFTMGASFGATRELQFLHEPSDLVFGFPQGNGDVFAFTTEVNSKFKHGVPRPKQAASRVGPRFSIIAWGRRRSINKYNGGTEEVGVCKQDMGSLMTNAHRTSTNAVEPLLNRNEVAMGMDEMARLVQETQQLGLKDVNASASQSRIEGAALPQRQARVSRRHRSSTSSHPTPGQGTKSAEVTNSGKAKLLEMQATKEAQAKLIPRLKKHLGKEYNTFRDLSNDCQYGRVSADVYFTEAQALFLATASSVNVSDKVALDLLLTTLQLMPNRLVREQVLANYQGF